MKIIVDGDACPAKEAILQIGNKYKIPVIIIVSLAHWQNFDERAEWVTVDNISQAADLAVINRTQVGDVVVTDDYGLAALVLAKKGLALSFRGRIYREENMDNLLAQRHLFQKNRRVGQRLKGPKPYEKEDELRLRANLSKLIDLLSKET